MGAKAISNSTAGKNALADNLPVQTFPSTPTAMLATVDAAGELTSVTVFVLAPDADVSEAGYDQRGGSVISVPINADSGSGEQLLSLHDAYALGGEEELRTDLESAINLTIDHSRVMTADEFSAFLGGLPAIQVDLPRDALGADGAALYGKGPVVLSPAQAAQIITANSPTETEGLRQPNIDAFCGVALPALSAPDARPGPQRGVTDHLRRAGRQGHRWAGRVGGLVARPLPADRNPEGLDIEELDRTDTILVFASISPAQMTRPASGLEASKHRQATTSRSARPSAFSARRSVTTSCRSISTPSRGQRPPSSSTTRRLPRLNQRRTTCSERSMSKRPTSPSAASTSRSCWALTTSTRSTSRRPTRRRRHRRRRLRVGRSDRDHRMSTATAAALAVTAARTADDKKAERTLVLFVGDVLSITEYFVITSVPNGRLVRMVVDEIEIAVREQHGRSPLRVEGVAEQQWVLIDYGDAVIHVFSDEIRADDEIERLYRDVPKIDWQAERPDVPSEASVSVVLKLRCHYRFPARSTQDNCRSAPDPVTVTVARTIAPGWEAEVSAVGRRDRRCCSGVPRLPRCGGAAPWCRWW